MSRTRRGWPAGAKPTAADGMAVNAFATGLDHPRTVYVLPNGDVLVAETNAPPKPDDGNGHQGLGDEIGDGPRRRRHAERQPHHAAARCRRRRRRRDAGASSSSGLNSPFGMALVGDDFYVANTDAIVKFPYHDRRHQDHRARRQACRPARRPHQSPLDQGSRPPAPTARSSMPPSAPTAMSPRTASRRRQIAPRCSKSIAPAASGACSPPACAIRTGRRGSRRPATLWVVVNERDELGNDLVPDYMTSVKDGAFYGWPYSYFGHHVDDARPAASGPISWRRRSRPIMRSARTPRRSGSTFNTGDLFPTADGRRRLHRPARFVESQAARRLQGDLRAVHGRQALRAARRTC